MRLRKMAVIGDAMFDDWRVEGGLSICYRMVFTERCGLPYIVFFFFLLIVLPSGNLTQPWKITIFDGNIHYT